MRLSLSILTSGCTACFAQQDQLTSLSDPFSLLTQHSSHKQWLFHANCLLPWLCLSCLYQRVPMGGWHVTPLLQVGWGPLGQGYVGGVVQDLLRGVR